MHLKKLMQLFCATIFASFFGMFFQSRNDIRIIKDIKDCQHNVDICRSEAKVFVKELREDSITLKY